jgi:hypothetical protein
MPTIEWITANAVERKLENLDDTCAELFRAGFALLHNPKDWKGPINAVVPRITADFFAECIRFMTATEPVYANDVKPGFVRLLSIGYRAGPAGDH